MRVRRAGWSRAALVAVALAGMAGARGAWADGRRILFVSAASSPFTARLRAEIEAMGFEIEPATTLDETTTATTIAAVHVFEGPARRVELWITDRTTGRLVLRTLVTPSASGDEASQTVRASEELRAFLAPLREPEAPLSVAPPVAPSVAPSAPPPKVADPVRHEPAPKAEPPVVHAPPATNPPPPEPSVPPSPRFVVAADLAVPFQVGGPGFDVVLRGRWMATRVLGLGAFVGVPVVGSTVKAPQGSASVAAPIFTAEVVAGADVHPRLRLSGTAGLGVAWVRTSGFATAPYQGVPSDVASALVTFGGEIALRLTERMHLDFGGRLGFALPRVAIAFSGEPVAFWGRPLGVVSAGLGVDL